MELTKEQVEAIKVALLCGRRLAKGPDAVPSDESHISQALAIIYAQEARAVKD